MFAAVVEQTCNGSKQCKSGGAVAVLSRQCAHLLWSTHARLQEGPLIETSNKFQCAWIGFLAGCTVALGPMAMLNLYVLPCEPG